MDILVRLLHYVQNNALLSAFFTVAGSIAMFMIQRFRGRVKTLEYRVSHQRIGISANDAVHGIIEILWRKNMVTNLFLSTITVKNEISSDFKDLVVVVWSPQETMILTEQSEIKGSALAPVERKEFLESAGIAAGKVPDKIPDQFYHRREYVLGVLNRGNTITFTYLVTVPGGGAPALWFETQQPGLQTQYRETTPETLGVSVKSAAVWGLAISLVLLPAINAYADKTWAISIAFGIGAAAQIVGAIFLRTCRAISRTFLS